MFVTRSKNNVLILDEILHKGSLLAGLTHKICFIPEIVFVFYSNVNADEAAVKS